jgi:tetratricopeptide (TPR) repeat protein
LTSSGNYAEGIVAHRKAVELDTSYKEGWTHLAQSYKELADADKAIECLQKAVALDGKYDYRTQYLETQNGCYLYSVYRTHLLAHFTSASEEHHDGRIF